MDSTVFGWSLLALGGHYWLYLSSGGPGLEVCGSGSGSGVSVGLLAGLSPGFGSSLHPGHLQVGQHHCPELQRHQQLSPVPGTIYKTYTTHCGEAITILAYINIHNTMWRSQHHTGEAMHPKHKHSHSHDGLRHSDDTKSHCV